MAEVPDGSIAHYQRMQRFNILGIALVRKAWQHSLRGSDSVQMKATWEAQVSPLAGALTQIQEQAAWSGLYANAAALAQQRSYVPPVDWAIPDQFAGFSSVTGRSLDDMYSRLGSRYIDLLEAGEQSFDSVSRWLDTITQGTIADAARDAVEADILTRPKIAYVRMLNPPSCELCIMLAGQIYWRPEEYQYRDRGGAFDRHDNCDCYQVPTAITDRAEAHALGLMDDPYEYFNSLSEAEQNKVFSKSRAQAIRDGADIYSVTGSADYQNQTYAFDGARRRTGLTTYSMSRWNYDTKQPTRLTPKGVYAAAAGDRQEALRLLRENGYLAPVVTRDGKTFARGQEVVYRPEHFGTYGPQIGSPNHQLSGDLMENLNAAAKRYADGEMAARAQAVSKFEGYPMLQRLAAENN